MIIRCYRLNARPYLYFFIIFFFFFLGGGGGGGGAKNKKNKHMYMHNLQQLRISIIALWVYVYSIMDINIFSYGSPL